MSLSPAEDPDPLAVADGAILTHLLTAEEREAGVLRGDGDLDLWVRLAATGLPLAAGGAVVGHLTHHSGVLPDACTELRGPEGWLADLAADTVVGLRLRDGALELSTVEDDVDPGIDHVGTLIEFATDAATEALRHYLDGDDESGPASPMVGLDTVVLSFLSRHPHGLDVPAPPLEMLFSVAGLQLDHGGLTLPGAPLDEAEAEELTTEEIWARVQTAVFLAGMAGGDPIPTEEYEALLRLLAVPAALEYAAETVEGDPLPAAALEQLRLAAGAGRAEQAAAALLAARSAEAGGDPTRAEALVHAALEHDPALPPALLDAAEYAATRGDLKAANDFLRRTGDHDHPLRAAVAPLTRPPDTGVGRNVPCPCGSGRKYKACCLLNEVHPLPARAPAVYAVLGEYAQRARFADVVESLDGYSPDGLLDLLILDLAVFDGGVVTTFLAERGPLMRADERALVESWAGTPILPYEVTGVFPGKGVTLTPLLGGEPVDLLDQTFSTGAEVGSLVVARLLTDGEGPSLLALPYVLEPEGRDELREVFVDYSPHRLLEFFESWLGEEDDDEDRPD